jgi:hypothetical protein
MAPTDKLTVRVRPGAVRILAPPPRRLAPLPAVG